MDYIESLQHFVAIVKNGGFSRAAHALDLPVSKISKSLKWLETEKLNTPLLFRTTRRLSLTPAGERFYEEAKPLLSQIKRLEQSVSSENVEPQGPVRLVISNALTNHVTMPLLTQFLLLHRKIYLETRDHNSAYPVLDGTADLAISSLYVEHERLIRHTLFRTKRGLFAAPSYLKKFGTPKTIQDLAHHNCLVSMLATPDRQWQFSEKESVLVNGNFASPSTADIIMAACEGLGVLYLSEDLVANAVNEGLLTKIPWQHGVITSTVYLYHEALPKGSAAHCLAEFIKATHKARLLHQS